MFWRRQGDAPKRLNEDAPKRPSNAGKAAGGAGALLVMLALVAPHTALFEGEKHHAYIDRIGKGHPVTICDGHTGSDVHLGMTLDHDGCLRLLMNDEAKAGRQVAACSPELVPDSETEVRPKTYLWAAATDFAFNTGYWCKTTMAKLFHQGRNREACRYFNHYIYAGGRPFEGLRRRRADLTALCMKGV
jgi:lysozyme